MVNSTAVIGMYVGRGSPLSVFEQGNGIVELK